MIKDQEIYNNIRKRRKILKLLDRISDLDKLYGFVGYHYGVTSSERLNFREEIRKKKLEIKDTEKPLGITDIKEIASFLINIANDNLSVTSLFRDEKIDNESILSILEKDSNIKSVYSHPKRENKFPDGINIKKMQEAKEEKGLFAIIKDWVIMIGKKIKNLILDLTEPLTGYKARKAKKIADAAKLQLSNVMEEMKEKAQAKARQEEISRKKELEAKAVTKLQTAVRGVQAKAKLADLKKAKVEGETSEERIKALRDEFSKQVQEAKTQSEQLKKAGDVESGEISFARRVSGVSRMNVLGNKSPKSRQK